jgi:predicted nucleotidyltransferase
MEDLSLSSVSLSDEFLADLIKELDNENVTVLALIGSYARGDATVYSDVDVQQFVREVPERTKHYFYFHDHLVGISIRTFEQYRKRFSMPQEAIFVIPSIRQARVLLDKEGEFARLQQEAWAWIWEPLQASANYYAGEVLMVHTEIVHKALRALSLQDDLALSEMILLIFSAVTDAMAVQRGILAESGNSYFRQVEDSIGQDTEWTHYHRLIAGVDEKMNSATSLEDKGIVALRLYQQTAQLLRSCLHSLHHDVIWQAVEVIDQALGSKKIL